VKNACGKKNPESQYAGGIPSVIHLLMKLILSLISLIQEARGFKESGPTFANA